MNYMYHFIEVNIKNNHLYELMFYLTFLINMHMYLLLLLNYSN